MIKNQEKKPPPRSLITGGSGFVGSHLCDRLLGEGHQVICFDNLLTGKKDNIQHLMDNPSFFFVQGDVTKPIDLPAALSKSPKPWDGISSNGFRLNYILHFASPASPRDYERYPIHTLKVGALGTYHALGLAKSTRSIFLLASTSETYGDPEVTPQPETYWGHVNPIGPRSVYDEAKRFAEAITMSYAREHNVKVRIVRIFNTYGERMRVDDGRALPNFLKQALQEKPLTIYGDGSQTRSFCYVGDLIEGIHKLLMSDEMGPFNLGSPEEITIKRLAEEIIELTGSRSKITMKPLPTDDPKRRWPDISKAVTTLNWKPKVGRREGIERVIAYFRSKGM